jgi:hypothetical protein
MQRIYDSTTELEAFQDGDILNKIPGTLISSDWLNTVQEELAGVVEGSGAALDSEDNGQLETAIDAKIAAGAAPAQAAAAAAQSTADQALAVANNRAQSVLFGHAFG